MDNQIAIITGSIRGFGKEFARRLLQDGCKVCLSDVDETKGLETKATFQKNFGLGDDGVCFVKCDVTVKDDWTNLWNSAEKFLGGNIDILMHRNILVHTPANSLLATGFSIKNVDTIILCKQLLFV